MPAPKPTRPAALDPRAFSSFHSYQTARRRELTRARIRNLRATNPHLSLAQVASHVGVSIDVARAALAPDLSLPG